MAVAFFGGFLVKSYWEERVFQRDTERLLTYYKYAIPGSIQDGDEHNARYLVWKYRGKKDKLWKRLEIKYGVPVRYAHEWGDYNSTDKKDEREDVHDLDDEEEQKGKSPTHEDDDEPDL